MPKKWDWDTVLYEGTTLQEECTGEWRWGTCHRRVFLYGTAMYAVQYQTQVEEGIDQSCGDPVVYEVEGRDRTVIEYMAVRKSEGPPGDEES